MITVFNVAGKCLVRDDSHSSIGDSTIWIDLLNPTIEEELEIERGLDIDVPTREEMREIEVSNRFYTEGNAHFMTALLMQAVAQDAPVLTNVTFILTGNRLVSVRYSTPRSFDIFADKACRGDPSCKTGAQVLMGLIELFVQRQADHIERIQDEVEGLASNIFLQKIEGKTRGRRLDVMLRTVGKSGHLSSRALESAVSLNRTLHYFAEAVKSDGAEPALLGRIESATRDMGSLADHLKALSGRIAFLLDATLGMISNEQNQIIKLFSVMAVMLMPPTLVASVYGMNFKHMPELDWPYGYPIALALMFVSALVPFLYFRRKGWL
ncbi:MAG: magnesium transporter CorA family protein [Hyphomicrobiaceae bacterium]|nr:magnesium transporter CorA family protein [Hyphomicrobiaceae bacterium]